jgi:hypothetical protein
VLNLALSKTLVLKEKDMLKKVVGTVPFGELITDNTLNSDDFTDCSRQASVK